MLRLNGPMHRYGRMGTGLSQMSPVFRQKDPQVGFRPEWPGFEAATGANERDIPSLNMRVNAAAAGNALNIPGNETGGGIACTDKSQAIRVS